MKNKSLKSVHKLRLIFLVFIFFYVGLCYSQTYHDDYSQFTPERRLVLNKMGEFFDETIRKNFPTNVDTLSYINFQNCFWQTVAEGFPLVLNVDKKKLKEINQILFKDHNFYFFYVRVIDMWPSRLTKDYVHPVEDSIPTHWSINSRGVKRQKYLITPELNRKGYITVPEDDPVVKYMKENYAKAGGLSPTNYSIEFMVRELSHELSQPVKEYLAVIYWKYLCILAGVDMEERKAICETCDI